MPKSEILVKARFLMSKTVVSTSAKFGILVLAKFLTSKYRHSISHILVSKILVLVSAKFLTRKKWPFLVQAKFFKQKIDISVLPIV